VLFTVTDTGIGVASGARARIFEPFFQVETSKARRVAGTGLGLSVTRHLARLLGGDVTLSATGGGGSSFEVRIPRHISGRRAMDPDDSVGDRALAVLPEASSISASARSRAAST
jgi:signal transduction histidine kinase